jgi:hypothetical protein
MRATRFASRCAHFFEPLAGSARSAEHLLRDPGEGGEMTPIVWIIAALVLLILVLRFLFKLAGWLLKLLILAAVGLAIWWLFSGV